MSFDDSDLAKLEEHIKLHFGDFGGECQLTAEGLQELLARLEAAEKFIECRGRGEGEKDKALEAWRKACGL